MLERYPFRRIRRRQQQLSFSLSATARFALDEIVFGTFSKTALYPRWPAKLPVPILSGSPMKRAASAFIRTDMEVGAPRQRRRTTAVWVSMPVKWRFSAQEFGAFEAFIHYKLLDGASWFTVALDTPLGWREVTARFSVAPEVVTLTGLNKEVIGTLDVRDWPVMPEADLAGWL